MATVTKPIALDESFNTTEVTPRNIADVLADELSRITGRNASQVEYDNTESELTADNVQDALDEIVEDIPTVPSVDIQTAVDEFETYNGGLLSSLKVSLTPNQDLHGYDSPWVGGAGKNKLNFNLSSQTINGVTLTNNNGVLTLNGTNDGTGNSDFAIGSYPSATAIIPSGTYKFIVSDTNKSVRMLIGYNGSTLGSTYTSDIVNASNGISAVIIRVATGVTVNNVTVKPMVTTDQSLTYDDWTPYENICPISGHTEVDVDVSDGQATQEQIVVNLGGTYYGGVLDVVTGEMTLDRKYKKGFTRGAIDSSGKLYKVDELSDAVNITSSSGVADLDKSNMGIFLGLNSARTSTDFCLSHYSTSFYVGGMVGKETELDALLPNLEIIYELATPLTIQLSPTTVKALVGENHLSAPLDGQEITESKYKQMFTFDDVIAYIQSLS